tara:strand:+ start:5141 stop:6022 length:882 start_codon:yes stop_codon:yes gene_type:complete
MTSTVNPDYWSLLGLEPGSSNQQLKNAFRREARKWHPDLNGNDYFAEERFKLVNEAYAVLSDPIKRDRWEKAVIQIEKPFSAGFPDFEEYLNVVLDIPNGSTQKKEDIDEIYENHWPSPEPAPSPPSPIQANEDLETVVELTPEQALMGTQIELELEDSLYVQVQTPPFAGDGWRLRLEGVARGGRDHFIQLRVLTEDGLRIDGLRVLYKLELYPPDAILGCAIDVPTLDGFVTLQVPPRSSSGRLLRLRGRGLEYSGRRGDQLVEIVIVVPDNLKDDEDALYLRLQELYSDE